MSSATNPNLDIQFLGADDGSLYVSFFIWSDDDGRLRCGGGIVTEVFDVVH